MEIAILIAVVVGVTEALKRALAITDRYVPIVALVLGIGGAILFIPGEIIAAIGQGIIAGLSASGLYSQTKTLAGK